MNIYLIFYILKIVLQNIFTFQNICINTTSQTFNNTQKTRLVTANG